MKLSLVERETILLYNQAEPMAEVYTHEDVYKRQVLWLHDPAVCGSLPEEHRTLPHYDHQTSRIEKGG